MKNDFTKLFGVCSCEGCTTRREDITKYIDGKIDEWTPDPHVDCRTSIMEIKEKAEEFSVRTLFLLRLFKYVGLGIKGGKY